MIPIGDKLVNYPNLQSLYAPFLQDMTANDGNQYILELYSVTQTAPIFTDTGPGFFIQKGCSGRSGISHSKDPEEYFKLIGEYKTKHPEIDGIRTIVLRYCLKDGGIFA
jgi:putative aldouronate transport system substrate-binding protein